MPRRSEGKLTRFIELAVKSLLRRKLRSTLGILGVVCGVAAVLSMLSIGEGAKRKSLAQMERLGTRNIYVRSIPQTGEQGEKAHARLSHGLTLFDAQRILNGCRDVGDVACLTELKASVLGASRDVAAPVVSCTPNYSDLLEIPIENGRFVSDEDIRENRLVCVIGHSVAAGMGGSGSIGNYLRIEDSLFKIVGVFRNIESKSEDSVAIKLRNYNEMVFIPQTAARLVDSASQGPVTEAFPNVTELVIKARTSKQLLKAVAAVKRTLEITHGGVEDYQMVVPQELLEQSRKIHRTFDIVIGSVAFISLLAGGIGIMNIMLATVSERTREIGVRRAFGATRGDIVIQILAESTILTFAGGVIGIVMGLGAVWLISAIGKWDATVTPLSLLLPLLTSIAVGLFFGLVPACAAAKMDPIAALRSE